MNREELTRALDDATSLNSNVRRAALRGIQYRSQTAAIGVEGLLETFTEKPKPLRRRIEDALDFNGGDWGYKTGLILYVCFLATLWGAATASLWWLAPAASLLIAAFILCWMFG